MDRQGCGRRQTDNAFRSFHHELGRSTSRDRSPVREVAHILDGRVDASLSLREARPIKEKVSSPHICCTYLHICMYVCMYEHVSCMHIYLYIRIYVYVCMYVRVLDICMYVYCLCVCVRARVCVCIIHIYNRSRPGVGQETRSTGARGSVATPRTAARKTLVA